MLFNIIKKPLIPIPYLKTKSDLAKQAADLAKKLGDPLLSIEWMGKAYNLAKNPSNVDLYNLGRAYLDAGKFTQCDSIGNMYSAKYPNHTYGYYLRALANWRVDTTMELGSANPYFQKLIEVGSPDSLNNKSQLKLAYRYFVGYYATVKRDYPTAITHLGSAICRYTCFNTGPIFFAIVPITINKSHWRGENPTLSLPNLAKS